MLHKFDFYIVYNISWSCLLTLKLISNSSKYEKTKIFYQYIIDICSHLHRKTNSKETHLHQNILILSSKIDHLKIRHDLYGLLSQTEVGGNIVIFFISRSKVVPTWKTYVHCTKSAMGTSRNILCTAFRRPLWLVWIACNLRVHVDTSIPQSLVWVHIKKMKEDSVYTSSSKRIYKGYHPLLKIIPQLAVEEEWRWNCNPSNSRQPLARWSCAFRTHMAADRSWCWWEPEFEIFCTYQYYESPWIGTWNFVRPSLRPVQVSRTQASNPMLFLIQSVPYGAWLWDHSKLGISRRVTYSLKFPQYNSNSFKWQLVVQGEKVYACCVYFLISTSLIIISTHVINNDFSIVTHV